MLFSRLTFCHLVEIVSLHAFVIFFSFFFCFSFFKRQSLAMLCRLQTCHSLVSKILWLPPTPTYQVKAFKTWEEFSLFHIILFFCSLHKVIRVQKKWNKHRKSIMTRSDHSSYICKIFFNLEFPVKLNRTKGRKRGGQAKSVEYRYTQWDVSSPKQILIQMWITLKHPSTHPSH